MGDREALREAARAIVAVEEKPMDGCCTHKNLMQGSEGGLLVNEATVRLTRLPHAAGLPLPAYQTAGAAAMDLVAAVPEDEPIVLSPGARALVPTGLALEVPCGLEAQVRPRSGLALKHGVTVLNSPGTIDSDYRGEVGVLLVNTGDQAFAVHRGDRIAQLVIAATIRCTWHETAGLMPSVRGTRGYGSTGR